MWDVQLMSIAAVTLLAVISPGPDFAVVMRNSIGFGRFSGLATALGIACGVIVHITYTLLGFGFIMKEAVWVLDVMRYVGAGYLIWLGVSALFLSKKADEQDRLEAGTLGWQKAFRDGFICNALNPKTALFFIALFSQVVDPQSTMAVQVGIGAYIAFAHLIWFAGVAFILTHDVFKGMMLRAKNKIEKGIGACLCVLGVKLLMIK